jgi:hypothetical protein
MSTGMLVCDACERFVDQVHPDYCRILCERCGGLGRMLTQEEANRLIMCYVCEKIVEATDNGIESGRCKGLVLYSRYTWICEEGDCIKKYNEAKEQQRRDRDKETLEDYNESIKDEEEEEKRKPIVGYVRQIRGIRLTKDIPFEEYCEARSTHDRFFSDFMKEALSLKPDDMTDEEWKIKERRRHKKDIERMKQNKVDQKLRRTVAPKFILEGIIDEIGCMCTAEELRQNKFCNSCILFANVKEYLLRLFKGKAEAMK